MNNQYLLDHLRVIPDFPQKGIQFRDVTTLFKDAKCLDIMEEEMYELYKDKGITKVGFFDYSNYGLEKITILNPDCIICETPDNADPKDSGVIREGIWYRHHRNS